jgi:plastocyanin
LRRRLALLMAAGLVAGAAALPANPALANHEGTLAIDVGRGFGNLDGMSFRFLSPYTIRVHRGDTVTFNLSPVMSAGLLPTDTSAQDWLDDNWYSQTGAYSPIAADDEAGELVDNFGKIDAPSDPACGNAGEPACDYDGRSFVYSGTIFGQGPPGDGALPDFPFSVTIDAQPGDRIWVVNLVFPGERMKIVVVPNGEPATTQAEIDTAEAAQFAHDQEWALATHSKMKAKRTSHVAADGTRVWDAWAGMDSEHASLWEFYPRNLRVKKGQRIRWHFSQLMNEIHTVSMPVPAIFPEDPASFFGPFECDSPTAADVEATFTPEGGEEPQCPEGTTVEFEFGPFLTGVGNGTWSGMGDVEHSGFRGADLQHLSPPLEYNDPFTVKMNKTTGKTPMEYICYIHDEMNGFVSVKSP